MPGIPGRNSLCSGRFWQLAPVTQGEKQSREDKTRGENFPTAGIKIPSEAHTLMPKAEAAPVPSGEDGLGSGEQGSGELGSGLCLGELD